MEERTEDFATAISIRASRKYVKAMRAVADTNGRTVADMVREAVDAKFGEDVSRYMTFFANGGYKNIQSDTKAVKAK